jgi:hypothetical protein
LDGYGPIALVGAAAGLCDGVAGCQDATSGSGVAESCGQATLALEIHDSSGIEHWKKEEEQLQIQVVFVWVVLYFTVQILLDIIN